MRNDVFRVHSILPYLGAHHRDIMGLLDVACIRLVTATHRHAFRTLKSYPARFRRSSHASRVGLHAIRLAFSLRSLLSQSIIAVLSKFR